VSKGALNILIIDDDSGDVELVRRHLEEIAEWRTDLLAFTTAEDGLASVPARRPDVVLLDYVLGATTGLDALGELQKAGLDAPVVMLTGYGDEELAVRAIHAGAADYIPKGALSAQSLQRAISNAIEKHGLRQAVEQHRQLLERMNRDLIRKNEDLQTFSHVLSHELKTPLTSLREFLSILLDGLAGELAEEPRSYLALARESCDQMVRHVNDLVDVSRLETGKLVVQLKPASVADLMDRAVDSMSPIARRQRVEVGRSVEPETLRAVMDAQRMTQVLTNLVSNALQFTPPGGAVFLRAWESQDHSDVALLSVTDSGPGIAQEDVPRIFDRFYQTDTGGRASRGGLGLGLHICRELVTLHGGKIWVESHVGVGTTFYIAIPKDPTRHQLAISPGRTSR
jgi:signal transduction histidine kinase